MRPALTSLILLMFTLFPRMVWSVDPCVDRYGNLEKQFRDERRRESIRSLVDDLPRDQAEAAGAFLRALPARHPFSLWLDGLKPGRRDTQERMLRLALLEFDPTRASLLERASKDLKSLSLEERRALALHLRGKWWFDADSRSLNRSSAVMDKFRWVSGALDHWLAAGRGPTSPRQLETLIHDSIEERWHHGLRQFLNREEELRAVARTLQAAPDTGRARLLRYFQDERTQLTAAIAESKGLTRMNLQYLQRRLDQLIEYASIPEADWARVARRNPRYQQFLLETLPAGIRFTESTVAVVLPTSLLTWWINSQKRAPREAELPPLAPEPGTSPSRDDYTSTAPAMPGSGARTETPEQALIRQLNSEEITQAEFDRRLREINQKRR